MREVVSGSGYLSQRSRVATFGLGDNETVHSIRVQWPLGKVERFDGPTQRGSIELIEGEGMVHIASLPEASAIRSEAAGREQRATEPGTWLAKPVPAPDFTLRSISDDQ